MVSAAGEVLDDRSELLWRNAHPDVLLDGDRLSSQLFRPSRRDQGRLSVARSAVVTAADHWREYATQFHLDSAGVWAVSVGEADEQALPVVHDEHTDDAPDPCPRGHASIDFTGLTGGAIKRRAAALRDAAQTRGRIHPPPAA